MLKYRLWRLRKSIQASSQTTLKFKRINIAVEQDSTHIINLVGYIILFLTLLDYGFLLASSQVFDPSWAYNTSGSLVENVWGFLLGFLLIFYRRDQDVIKPIEFKFLSFLSWFILLIGISYFLIVPVILGNSFRLHRANSAQVTSQVSLQNSQVEQYAQQLQQATPEQLNILLQRYQQTGDATAASAPQLKASLIDLVKQQQSAAKQELQTQLTQQKKSLLKTTTKWSIGAIVSGVCFILIWKHTKWTRMGY